MEQDTKSVGRQAPEPEPKNDNRTGFQKSRETSLGDKPRNPSRNQEMMMEQDAKRIGRQAPEP